MIKGIVTARLERRERKTYPVDLADVLGLDAPAPALVRLSSKTEDDGAVIDAHAHAERMTKPLGPEAAAAARADADLLGDAKNKGALARVYRDAADPSQPLFPSAEWIGEHLSTDEIAALVNVYYEIRRVASRAAVPDAAGVAVLLDLLADMADRGDAVPGAALGPYPREIVTYLLVEAAVERRALRLDLAALKAVQAPEAEPEPQPDAESA